MNNTNISKFLSLILRHKPEVGNIELDENGWADIDKLVIGASKAGNTFSKEQLFQVVKESDKQRFIIEGNLIRANQGHSVAVSLNLKPIEPPAILYHGTVEKFIDKIYSEGLKKMNRHHVHLSENTTTAENVASRRGTPIILKIDSADMYTDGHEFMCSENNVWLTDNVPSKYISIIGRDV